MNKNLATVQKKELLKISNTNPGFSCQGKIGRFLDSWLVCEVLAKKLIMYHKSSFELPERWTYPQLISASKYFSLPYDENEIKQIFRSGKGVRGNKTSRQLRNSYLHSLSPNDLKEISRRNSMLLSYMKKWKDKVISHKT